MAEHSVRGGSGEYIVPLLALLCSILACVLAQLNTSACQRDITNFHLRAPLHTIAPHRIMRVCVCTKRLMLLFFFAFFVTLSPSSSLKAHYDAIARSSGLAESAYACGAQLCVLLLSPKLTRSRHVCVLRFVGPLSSPSLPPLPSAPVVHVLCAAHKHRRACFAAVCGYSVTRNCYRPVDRASMWSFPPLPACPPPPSQS